MQNDSDRELQSYFTDVEHLRDWFNNAVAAPSLTKRLFIIHGVGGVGKSSLLRMFRLHCKSVRVPVALASGDEQKSTLDVLTRWTDDLKADGVALPAFGKTYTQYRAIQAKVDAQAKKAQDARERAADIAGKAASKTAEVAGGALAGAAIGSVIPGIGTAIGGALGGALGGMGAEALVARYAVAGLLTLTYSETVHERHVRKYGGRPAETRTERSLQLAVARDAAAIATAERRLGWRVYGANQPAAELTLEQAVLAYRDEYLVERGFGRLKGRSLSLTPMYLADDDRATGLIRWLTVGLRVLTLLEGVVRRRLQELGTQLAGLYAGNPTRATARPSAESLLRAFKGLALSVVTLADQTYRHVTPLSDVQHKILALLDYPVTIYAELTANSVNPP